MKPRHRFLPILFLVCASAPVHASDWEHEVAPYLWGAALDGRSGVGDLSVDVDASFGDILDNLELGFMGAWQAQRDQLWLAVDVVYMGLGADGRGPSGFVKGDVDVDQVALEVDVGHEMYDNFTVYAGLRYNDVSVKARVSGPLGSHRVDEGDSWIDPVVGAHYTIPFAEDWSLRLRGDIGGFSVGSEFAWQLAASLRWQLSPTLGMIAAYRYIDMDYDDGRGSDRFVYDMAISGPALGVVFSF